MSDVRLVLVERPGCHLCGPAREVVERVARECGEEWVGVNVDANPELLAAYGELVPVVLVDGIERGHWRLDEAELRRALRR